MARAEWTFFDKLPPDLRAALRTSAFEYNAQWFYDRWKEGFSVDRLIRHIKDCDLQYAAADIRYTFGGRRGVMRSPTATTGVMPLYR